MQPLSRIMKANPSYLRGLAGQPADGRRSGSRAANRPRDDVPADPDRPPASRAPWRRPEAATPCRGVRARAIREEEQHRERRRRAGEANRRAAEMGTPRTPANTSKLCEKPGMPRRSSPTRLSGWCIPTWSRCTGAATRRRLPGWAAMRSSTPRRSSRRSLRSSGLPFQWRSQPRARGGSTCRQADPRREGHYRVRRREFPGRQAGDLGLAAPQEEDLDAHERGSSGSTEAVRP
jgi:hypothetical protein